MFALAFMFAGMAIGFILRNTPVPALAARLLVPITCAMLFALGLAIGGNSMIMESLHTLGVQGLTFAVAGMTGSALAVSLICRLFPDREDAGQAQGSAKDVAATAQSGHGQGEKS